MSDNKQNEFILWGDENLTEQPKKSENNGTSVPNDTTTKIENVSTKNVLQNTTVSGIYKIVNKINGKYYVGSAVNFKRRWTEHRSKLKRNKHPNPHLQSAYNKYGENNFEYIICELVQIDKLLKIEQIYLDECKKNPKENYVISYCAIAPMLGRKPSEATKHKISLAKLGRKHTLETKIKMRKPKVWINKTMGKKPDNKIHTFRNTLTNEIFIGNRHEFYIKCQADKSLICRFINGKRKMCRKWILVST